MSFSDDVSQCMSESGLPTPSEAFDSLSDAMEFLHQLHNAWENSGGEQETTLAVLAVLGAATGIDEAAAAALGTVAAAAAGVTVGTYLLTAIACVVSTAGSAVWDALASPINIEDLWLRSQLTAQAEAQNIPKPGGGQNDSDQTFNA